MAFATTPMPASGPISLGDMADQCHAVRSGVSLTTYSQSPPGGKNTICPTYPDGIQPFCISEWYSYDHCVPLPHPISGVNAFGDGIGSGTADIIINWSKSSPNNCNEVCGWCIECVKTTTSSQPSPASFSSLACCGVNCSNITDNNVPACTFGFCYYHARFKAVGCHGTDNSTWCWDCVKYCDNS